jgi:hypothetical protein
MKRLAWVVALLVFTFPGVAAAKTNKPVSSKAVCSEARSLYVVTFQAGLVTPADAKNLAMVEAQLPKTRIRGANTRRLTQRLYARLYSLRPWIPLKPVVQACVNAHLVGSVPNLGYAASPRLQP